MAKKMSAQAMFIWFAVFALILVGGTYFVTKGSVQESVIQQVTETEEADIPVSEFCSNNPEVDFEPRALDVENTSSGLFYRNAKMALKNMKTGAVTTHTIDNGALDANYDTFSNAITCGHPYDVLVLSTQDGFNGGFCESLTSADTQTGKVKVDCETSAISGLKMRVWDNKERAFMFEDDNDQAVYVNLASSGCNFDSTTNQTALTVNADGDIDFEMSVKTQTADTAFGATTWLALDYLDDTNSDDWDDPSVFFTPSGETRLDFRGARLANVQASLTPNDILALNAYEAIYDLGVAITEDEELIDIAFQSGSGINPDKDIGWKFVGTGVELDSDNPNSFIGVDTPVAFKTDPSRTEIVTATEQKCTLDIA